MVPQKLTRDMGNFLDKVQTTDKMHVGNDAFVAAEQQQTQYITQVKGATLPMRIRLVYQPPGQDEAGNTLDSEIIQFQLLVNPENMNHGKTNTVQPVYTRTGFVTQLWGSNQDSISVTGKSAAFMVAGAGLTSFAERWSLGFHNLMALMAAYRNNGYQYMDPLKGVTDKHLSRVVEVIRGVELSYDGDAFLGHFNNFTFDEDAAAPYLININFEFMVSALTGFDSDTSQIRGHFVPAYYTQWNRGELNAKQEKILESDAYKRSKALVGLASTTGDNEGTAQEEIANGQRK